VIAGEEPIAGENRTMPESYPDLCERPSMEAPELPQLPQRRFQFSLRSLLAFMFGAAILATGVRYLMQLLEPLPKHQLIALSNALFVSVALSALLYYIVRAPFLVTSADRIGRRWQQLQDHRRQLDRWSQSRRKQAASESASPQNPSPPD
jgi:hypothetical protein